ncbi:MAG: hypothetical protein IPO29_09580 [Anaerolineae bacterium]|nr:hypothetical protein [Anaerolineae bacterium]
MDTMIYPQIPQISADSFSELLGAYQIPFNDQPNLDNGQSAEICEICGRNLLFP